MLTWELDPTRVRITMNNRIYLTFSALLLTAQMAHALDTLAFIPDLLTKEPLLQSTTEEVQYLNGQGNEEHNGWKTFLYILLTPVAILDEKTDSLKLSEQSLLEMGYQPAEIQQIAVDLAKITSQIGHKYTQLEEVRSALRGLDLAPVTREILDLR